MITQFFACAKCQFQFEAEILEPHEIKQRHVETDTSPVTCPNCESTAIFDLEAIK